MSAVNTGFLGIAVWAGLTGSTGRYTVGYPSNSAFDNEDGNLWRLLYPSDVHHKGPLFVRESVSFGIKHLSVYHTYLYAMQLAK